jgi:hypothetical protein
MTGALGSPTTAELAGASVRAGTGAGDGGRHPADPLLAVLERAHPRPVAVAVADALADEAADDARELPVLPGVPRCPPELLLRRDDRDPVALADIGFEEVAQGRSNALHRGRRQVDVVDEEQKATALGRRPQAGAGEPRGLVERRRAPAAHDDRLEGLDGLAPAFLLDREVLAGEARHRPPVLVEHDHVEAHEVDSGSEDRRCGSLLRSAPARQGGEGEGDDRRGGGRSEPHSDSRSDAAGRVKRRIPRDRADGSPSE